MPEVLILYYSRGGAVASLARQIARGVEEIDGMAGAPAHRATGGRGHHAGRTSPSRTTVRPTFSNRDLRRVLCPDPRQPDALRQHGRSAEALP
jgi:hypothetical protein